MSDYLHEDTVFQILKWLPAESLWRFRAVCKSWKERIDSQSFALDYLSSQKPQLIVDFDRDTHFLAFDPDELPDLGLMIRPLGKIPNRKFHLANTLHGIVCFYDEVFAQFVLWNPSICRFSVLTPPTKLKSFDFDELDTDGAHGGFWMDPSTREFKLVIFKLPVIEADEYDEILHAGLYSSARKDWQEISLDEIHGYHSPEITPPVVIEQVAYWTAFYEVYDDEQEHVALIAVVVVFFDFAREKFGKIHALSVKEGWHLPVLCNWEGLGPSLLYMDPDKGCDIYLWHGDEWVETFRTRVNSSISRVLWGAVQLDETGIKVRILATNKSRELVLFDTKNMTFRVLETGLKEGAHFATTFGFVESLLFPAVK